MRRLVLLGCQSAEPFSVEKHSERVDSSNHHIDSQVELKFVDKKRIVQVSLHNVVRIDVEVLQVSCQKDAATLTGGFRL